VVRFSRDDRLILALLCRGLSNKQIADEVEIAPKTAAKRIRRLFRKAGVTNDRELIVFTMQQPQALSRGRDCRRGLHPPGYVDTCPYCRAIALVA